MTERTADHPTNVILAAGPYLLGPRPDGLIIAWEADAAHEWTLDVWPEDRTASDPWERFPVHTRTEDIEGSTCTLLTAYVDGLSSGTRHEYRVGCDGSVVATGSFTTLRAEADRARLFLLSDSHMFTVSGRIEERIAAYGPDFVVHGGDIPAGTGHQKEQYTQGWFAKISETLADVPFVYTPGNHDDGPYFDFYFGDQTQERSHDPFGRSYSLDHAGVHLAMVDSNSWGLSEMNAVNSGIPIDREIRSRIDATLDWLREDLRSESARRARWRMVVLHHPYTDEFTNRLVVPVVEEAGVDLVIGAHLHEYIKTVSLDQRRGGRPVYLTLPSAQQPQCDYTTGDPGSRLMSDFPEVVATGNGNYATLEADADRLLVEVFGFREDSHRPELVDRVVLGASPAGAVLRQVSIEMDPEEGDPASVLIRGRAVNTTRQGIVAAVAVSDNGVETVHVLDGADPLRTRVIYLDPGEQAPFAMRHRLVGAGDHTIRVADTETRVAVPEETHVDLVLSRARLDRGRSAVDLLAEVTNRSPHSVTTQLRAVQDGQTVLSTPVHLDGGEVEAVSLSVPHPGPGTHRFALFVDTSEPIADSSGNGETPSHAPAAVELAIDDSLVVTPLVRDRSDHGNDAIIRGHPRLVGREDGTRYVRLDHAGDYLEIPPSPSLVLPEGYVAGARTRIDRLAEPDEMAHNPLMVRGKGVGWGATYFLRMVVDRTGTMKWGTCHGATEYGWAGGAAKVGAWADYVLAFDRRFGGRSFIDGDLVSDVPGIDDKVLNGYTDEPIFIGYSRIGHVIADIAMPKYVTHLWGCVGDVRLAGPGAFGRSSRLGGMPEEDLRLWLDFSDIALSGAHTTEWRRPRGLRASYLRDFDRWRPTSLHVEAEIPPDCRVQVSVETSDDADRVLDSVTLDPCDGVDELPLEGLPPAQYARITTRMTGGLDGGELQVPRIRRLALDCEGPGVRSTLSWSTDADWRSGQFTGAIGIEAPDRLRVFDEYTDVIHG
ncbi:purple acid phosphatase family protein [Acidipropionibacterium acidipropionici]|uniref:purple acid phosphatase family protein n=1 Tax=Acidipropionibacterium acidipropionici TaxID=1748 RepID=UPI00110B9E02|nr:metallophosphoesterase family protein [Acidipropionibacterium acidipropionici]QCV96198.1 hypothetical protein FEZ30_13845 [Acidipropionibacterium acidipropionici]